MMVFQSQLNLPDTQHDMPAAFNIALSGCAVLRHTALLVVLLVVCISRCFSAESSLQPKPSVLVIGAGLSGLNGALLLEEQGFTVTVLEARKRVGGRLYTLDNVPGQPEGGGNIIGASYARILDRTRQLKLEIQPAADIVGGRDNMQLYVDGQFIEPRQWSTAAQNPFPEALKALPPGSALFSVLSENPLQRPEDWVQPEFAAIDRPMAELFAELGLNQRAMSLVNHGNSYGNSLASTSLLQMYHIQSTYTRARGLPGGTMAVAGGNQRLPEAMAGAVAGEVLTGKVVRLIAHDATGVKVICADGSEYRGDFALVTVPLGALRDIEITPVLPALQQRAISELNYTATLLAQFTVSGEYWAGQTPSLWSDTEAERLFATSLDGSGRVSNLTMWVNGENAMRFSAMAQTERDKAIYAALYAIYPRAKGTVELRAVVDWNNDPYSKGVWAQWLPGQIAMFAQALSKPAGRLFFAGEHTAVSNTGMEGAMESSERAVAEILAKAREKTTASLFIHCQGCHSKKRLESHKVGPNLWGFYGQPVASRQGYSYSAALAAAEFNWDRARLRRWLQAPGQLVPDNRMIYHNLYDQAELEQLLDYLSGFTGDAASR